MDKIIKDIITTARNETNIGYLEYFIQLDKNKPNIKYLIILVERNKYTAKCLDLLKNKFDIINKIIINKQKYNQCDLIKISFINKKKLRIIKINKIFSDE